MLITAQLMQTTPFILLLTKLSIGSSFMSYQPPPNPYAKPNTSPSSKVKNFFVPRKGSPVKAKPAPASASPNNSNNNININNPTTSTQPMSQTATPPALCPVASATAQATTPPF